MNLLERVDAMPELISIAKEIDLEEIVFLNHSDCLMYRGKSAEKPFEDLRETMDACREDFPGVKLTAMWAEIAPEEVRISEVRFKKGSFSLFPLMSVSRSR